MRRLGNATSAEPFLTRAKRLNLAIGRRALACRGRRCVGLTVAQGRTNATARTGLAARDAQTLAVWRWHSGGTGGSSPVSCPPTWRCPVVASSPGSRGRFALREPPCARTVQRLTVGAERLDRSHAVSRNPCWGSVSPLCEKFQSAGSGSCFVPLGLCGENLRGLVVPPRRMCPDQTSRLVSGPGHQFVGHLIEKTIVTQPPVKIPRPSPSALSDFGPRLRRIFDLGLWAVDCWKCPVPSQINPVPIAGSDRR